MSEAKDLSALVVACNRDGMEFLRQGKTQAAFEQLKYAESVLLDCGEEHTHLLAVTCNNLGCYYKRTGKLHAALSYLRRSLKIDVSLQTDDLAIGGTHLNICAILSKLDKHPKALQHALCALELIGRRLQLGESQKDDYATLAIAYHNVAVEREFLQEWGNAAMAYKQGAEVARRCLGERHALTQALTKSSETVLQKSARAAKPIAEKKPEREATAKPYQREERPAPPPAEKREDRPEPNEYDQDGQEYDAQPQQDGYYPLGYQGPPADYPQPQEQYGYQQAQYTPDAPFQPPPSFQSFQAMPPAQQPPPQQPPAPQQQPPPAPQSFQAFQAPFPSYSPAFSGPAASDEASLAPAIAPSPALVDRGPPPPQRLPRVGDEPPPLVLYEQQKPSAPGGPRPNRQRPQAPSTAIQVQSKLPPARGVRGARAKKAVREQRAAERIQRVWRKWRTEVVERRKLRKVQHAAATRLQARWRTHHLRAMKRRRGAITMQRHARGWLVRRALKRHKAAIQIQSAARGFKARAELRRLNRTAVRIQAQMRRHLAKKRVQQRRREFDQAARLTQRAYRGHKGRSRVLGLREDRRQREEEERGAQQIQAVYRGRKSRAATKSLAADKAAAEEEEQAATKIQLCFKRMHARRRVAKMRLEYQQKRDKAATVMATRYRGFSSRRQYDKRVQELANHEPSVVVIQRYARGHLVRKHLWDDAVRVEKELWASVQLQRHWRGHLGRLLWEQKYEEKWSREIAAIRIQRSIRGYSSRARVVGLRKKFARVEFARARDRFKAAQHLQALARGVQVRQRFRDHRAYVLEQVLRVQRVWRGHQLRLLLWDRVLFMRARMIQAAARGMLVRRRRAYVVHCVKTLQRWFRRCLQRARRSKELR